MPATNNEIPDSPYIYIYMYIYYIHVFFGGGVVSFAERGLESCKP